MTEQSPSAQLQTIPIHERINTKQCKEDTAALNALFAAHKNEKDMTAAEYTAEQEALSEFNQKYFGIDLLERPARLVTLVPDESDAHAVTGVQAINGNFIGAITERYKDDFTIESHGRSVVIKGMAYRAVAVLIDDGKTTYTIPLQQGYIMQLDVDAPPSRDQAPSIAAALRADEAVFSHLLQTETFLRSSLIVQQLQIAAVLEEINAIEPLCTPSQSDYSVTIAHTHGAGQTTLTADSLRAIFPSNSERQTRYKKLSDYEHGTGLWLELTNTESSSSTTVPFSSVIDITMQVQTDRETVDEEMDMLQLFASEDLVDTINKAEAAINYCEDEDERLDLILKYIEDLSRMMPENLGSLSFFAQGLVFREQYDDSFSAHQETLEDAGATDIDIKYIAGKWRVVLPLEVPAAITDSDTDEEYDETVYIVPSTVFTDILYAVPGECNDIADGYDGTLRDTCARAAEATWRLIRSKRFQSARYERQPCMIDAELAELADAAEQITEMAAGERVGMVVTQYYAVSTEIAGMTCSDIALLPLPEPDDYYIEFDDLSVAVPECFEPHYGKFRSVDDFPLSGGEAMFIAEDTKKGITYFVPARNVVRASTAIHVEPDS